MAKKKTRRSDFNTLGIKMKDAAIAARSAYGPQCKFGIESWLIIHDEARNPMRALNAYTKSLNRMGG